MGQEKPGGNRLPGSAVTAPGWVVKMARFLLRYSSCSGDGMMKPSILVLSVVASWLFAACGGSSELPGALQLSVTSQPPVSEEPAPVWPEGRAVGEACSTATQCRSNRCSADELTGGCGLCLSARRLGESCGGALQGCSLSAACVGGICVSKKKVTGEPCELYPKGGDKGDCDDQLYCSGDWKEGSCAARIPLGGACDYRTRCEAGAACRNEVCRPKVLLDAGLEEPCQGRPCLDGLRCDETLLVCKPGTLEEGALCGLLDGQFLPDECAPGLTCYDPQWPNGGGGQDTVRRCHPLPGTYESCALGRCAEGLTCSGYTAKHGELPVCGPLRQEGEVCAPHSPECVAGLECRAGACRVACR